MPDQEPVMPDQEPPMSPAEPAVPRPSAEDTAAAQRQIAAHETMEEQDEWLEEPVDLPPRPRRRLLSPVPLALLGVLLCAAGFIGGVLIEKGQTSSSAPAGATSGLASRFAALRAGASGGASGGSGASGAGGFGGGGAGATAGSVAYISGNTLYVTSAEGDTIKVNTSPGTTVTKTVKGSVTGIHPGETVTVTGASGANGAITAESIRVGAGAGGGLGALFSGSGAGAGKSSSSRGGGEPALFGGG